MQASVNGIRINYEWSGKRGGDVVLLSHAVGSSLVMWQPQIDALGPNFSVLRYDMRGHGGSEAPVGPYTIEQLGDDAVGLLNVLGIDKVHYLGLSIGGMIGQYIGVAHSDRLRSLALANTYSAASKEAQTTIQGRIDLARSKGMQALLESTMERWFTSSFFEKNPPILGMIHKQFLLTSVEGYVGCFQAIQKFSYTDRLRNVNVRTLVITGDQDPGTPVSVARGLHERIKDSQLVIIPSARHASNVEQPELFNRSLVEFLTRRSRNQTG